MPVVAISGPERAGKSSLIKRLQARYPTSGYRHWSKIKDVTDYIQPLCEDIAKGLVFWDRSSLCEVVYSHMLDRKSPFNANPWMMQMVVGRAAQTWGLQYVLKGPPPEVLESRRGPDDHPVDPAEEQALYVKFGREAGWIILNGEATDEVFGRVCMDIDQLLQRPKPRVLPPLYVGPDSAKVVIVGETRNPTYGHWHLPFSSKYTLEFAKLLGPSAFKVGWTNAHDVPPDFFKGRTLVALGKVAQEFAKTTNALVTLSAPHPAWAFRYGFTKGAAEYDGIVPIVQQTVGS